MKTLIEVLDNVVLQLRVWSDSSAARGACERLVIQSIKHLHLRHMYIKKLVHNGIITMNAISGKRNPTDMLTKEVDAETLQMCLTLTDGLKVADNVKQEEKHNIEPDEQFVSMIEEQEASAVCTKAQIPVERAWRGAV